MALTDPPLFIRSLEFPCLLRIRSARAGQCPDKMSFVSLFERTKHAPPQQQQQLWNLLGPHAGTAGVFLIGICLCETRGGGMGRFFFELESQNLLGSLAGTCVDAPSCFAIDLTNLVIRYRKMEVDGR